MRTIPILSLGLPLVLALLVLGLAVPRLLGAWAMLPGNPVYDAMRPGGSRPDFADLRALMDSRIQALRWIDDPAAWAQLGAAQAALARRAGTRTPEGLRFVLESIESHRASLALAPADPYAWLRLANMTARIEGYSENVAKFLKMSVLTGPNERAIVLHRTQLALYAWPRFDTAGRALFARQIETHWGRFYCFLAPHVRATGTEAVFAEALATNERALAYFRKCMDALGSR